MATDGVDAAAPNLNLASEEKRVYGQLFRQADSDSVGIVTGETAVKFFEKTRLDSRVLGEIWQIADKENRGFLTPAGFGIVLRLIGHAQAGREPTAEIALQQGPLPRFDSIPLPTGGLVSPTPPPATALQVQGTGGGPIRIPPLTPEKVNQYAGLFERQPLLPGNLLPGDQAKSIFEKSGLPNEVLGRIWQLADTEQRGALVLTEFVIAMHMLTSMKTGALRGLPTILPAALYEAATRRGPSAPRQSPTSTGPLSAIPRQLSGSAQLRTASPLGRPPVSTQTTGQPTGDWLITPADKARFDALYDDLDKNHKGFITGEEAVPFLSQSNLPEDALAQIWDLSDINSEGRLTRDTFAVAMYLIRQQRSSRDGSAVIPTSLPPNLIPPGLRAQAQPTTSGSPFDAPPQHQPPASAPAPPPAPKSALDDLFGLDTPPAPAPAQVALSTGGSTANDPFGSGSAILSPSSPIRPSPTGTQFKPFVPSSSFGRGLTAQPTGDVNSFKSHAPAFSEDLLGDGDPEVSKKLTNETAELANLSNQVGSLSKQMQDVQGQRTTTQNELNQANSQKKNFEQRLAQLRTMYEKEAKDVEALQTQLNASRNETKKLQSECMNLDGTYRDLQTQHQQVLAGLQADQQENANLKEKIRSVNTEIAQLKPQIEKLRSEARQQKGLVAINKKQLVTNEAERDKLHTELTELAKGSRKPYSFDSERFPPNRIHQHPATSYIVQCTAHRCLDAACINPNPQVSSSTLPFAVPSEPLNSSRAASPPASGAVGFGDAALASSLPESDPFAAMDQSKAKADFEDAFASFTSTMKGSDKPGGGDAAKSVSAFDSEFPPISELDREDDDSDSASERRGFEDDFAPASPQVKKIDASDETTSPVGAAISASATETATPASPASEPLSPTATVAPAASETTVPADVQVAATASPARPTAPKAQSSFDELDDDFEGLEDAKEGSADDDFQTISRSGLDDFNPVFDSSPLPSQAKTESTTFGQESSFDLGSVSSNPATTIDAAAAKLSAAPAVDPQDWDAIFATLDSPNEASPPSGAATGTAQESRPAPGRALTQGGEHDDPILKNLTSMGYSREDSLLALEKYDYNLERAANYLASQS
ncbi:putative calcium-binding protein [Colletotrichum orbiculare MAFF 240422]|uniref:Calcium-binding protein n=1 Tax=Colletotrichum orbiculare (strain 104-T / ATCC 96160 / CBS 514.97 / LARS 414 / MAFF 240422) TaxID=1213857 RepID=A0A484FY70_COLOR|nr:putative calcium-binding protein [Colletotrichum orbiculare MAFF 240422]